jgi:hypothetical protein
MRSQTAAIMGPGSRQPASAGGPVFSRVGGLGARTFFGVGGGVTHGVLLARGLRGGGVGKVMAGVFVNGCSLMCIYHYLFG